MRPQLYLFFDDIYSNHGLQHVHRDPGIHSPLGPFLRGRFVMGCGSAALYRNRGAIVNLDIHTQHCYTMF